MFTEAKYHNPALSITQISQPHFNTTPKFKPKIWNPNRIPESTSLVQMGKKSGRLIYVLLTCYIGLNFKNTVKICTHANHTINLMG